jgi:hypothetical protein
MQTSRLPIIAFVLAVVLSTSAVAGAGWFRVDTGVGGGNYGGGSNGCQILQSGNYGGADVIVCPIADNSNISSYTSAAVYFTNSNSTQPARACVAYYNQIGGACSSTANNNCPHTGVCSFAMDISAWQNNPSHFKFASFDNITVGVLLSGYILYTTP